MDDESRQSLRALVLTALLAGAAVAGGYTLMAVPNVEVVTAILFIAGYAVGLGRGLIAAVTASLIYFGLNPQGGSFPPLLAAQVLGMGAAPLAGSLMVRISSSALRQRILLGSMGLIITLWYDIHTNLAFPFYAGMNAKGIAATLVLGIPFSAVHIASNVAIFMFLVPPLMKLLRRRRFPEAG